MKQLAKTNIKTFTLLMIVSFYQAVAMAQDSIASTSHHTTTTTTTTIQENWYSQPWVWIVGGIIFILLLAALLRGNSGNSTSDKITVTKTVTKDSE